MKLFLKIEIVLSSVFPFNIFQFEIILWDMLIISER